MSVYTPRSPGALYVQDEIEQYMASNQDLTPLQAKQILLHRYKNLDRETILHYHRESEALQQHLREQNPITTNDLDQQADDLCVHLSELCEENENTTVKRKLLLQLSYILSAVCDIPNNDEVFEASHLDVIYDDFHRLAHCLRKIIEEIEPEYFQEHDDTRKTAPIEDRDLN
jgi:hypothetical protein